MREQNWVLEEQGYQADAIAKNGNTFMIGNGYMGYRGTLEEYRKEQLAAVTLAGLYDQAGDKWREPVNAPNGLWTLFIAEGEPLSAGKTPMESHSQSLDFRHGVHKRTSVFVLADGNRVTVQTERFVSLVNRHLLAAKFTVSCSSDCELTALVGIDGEVWDINGPHLGGYSMRWAGGEGESVGTPIVLSAVSGELGIPVCVAQIVCTDSPAVAEQEVVPGERTLIRRMKLACRAGETIGFEVYAAVYTGLDGTADSAASAEHDCRAAAADGWSALRQQHETRWEARWADADVTVEGDEEAQFALRYSIYHLLIIAPTESERVSIPARGLSGQVYKGAVFWDTEMFMLPFFLHTDPATARNLLMYRCHTLDGARRKAAEYGYEGAFYAWESQDSGDDACTLFNVTDVFTGRPMRTYFRDKQVHISADVVHGIWQYIQFTGDESLLLEGGAEVILEVARFFYSYASYNPAKARYEILDVTGPDEYHERVHNNAFTNYLVREVLTVALEVVRLLESKYPAASEALLAQLSYGPVLAALPEMLASLYVPLPDPVTGVIEQFDRYYTLEEIRVPALKERMLNKHEYLGGGNGLATTTKVLKQADVVLMLHLFKDSFSREIKQANWEYYEPRTEHGSSLSPCVYALVAADIGSPDWAYPYFLRTATIDLTGESKQYVGDLYIGGTHPAANGGAWMAAILGFAGVHCGSDGVVAIAPALPRQWSAIGFELKHRGGTYRIRVAGGIVEVQAQEDNRVAGNFRVGGRTVACAPGERLMLATAAPAPDLKATLKVAQGAIFDLDGVIVDTAKYHFLAWRQLAEELGFTFTEEHNERLKGVSRMRSLDILLEIGGLTLSEEEKLILADRKNKNYVEYISHIDQSELLPGARDYLIALKAAGTRISLGSASKNAELILSKLNIRSLFDAVVDGNKVALAKPDPEVFLLACRELGLAPEDCVVYEDAAAGIEAALAAGMRTVGIGKPLHLPGAHLWVSGLHELLT